MPTFEQIEEAINEEILSLCTDPCYSAHFFMGMKNALLRLRQLFEEEAQFTPSHIAEIQAKED
jgi:hypothetical protein